MAAKRHSFDAQSDADLLRRYKESGELEVCGEIFRRHAHLITLLAKKYLKDSDDAQDAAMEVFEVLVKDLRVHDVNNLGGWLYRVVQNHCLKKIRSAKKEAEMVSDYQKTELNGMEIEFDPDHIDEKVLLEQKIEDLQSAVQKLPKEQQQCVELFYIQRKRYKEVSEITGYSLNEVKSYIQNGKRNLKNYLSPPT